MFSNRVKKMSRFEETKVAKKVMSYKKAIEI